MKAKAASAAVAERQRNFRKEVEAAKPPGGAEGSGRMPLTGAVSEADWGLDASTCSASAYLH